MRTTLPLRKVAGSGGEAIADPRPTLVAVMSCTSSSSSSSYPVLTELIEVVRESAERRLLFFNLPLLLLFSTTATSACCAGAGVGVGLGEVDLEICACKLALGFCTCSMLTFLTTSTLP